MRYYPVFLDLRARRATVVGGGEIAEGKVESLLRAEARVTVIAPEVTPRLAELARSRRIAHEPRAYARGDLRGAFLAISATGDAATDREIAREAENESVLLNVVDDPALCSFIAPAVFTRGDLQVAVSTSGGAPGFAAAVRDEIAGRLGPEYEAALDLLRRIRERLRFDGRAVEDRRRILGALVRADLPEKFRCGDRRAIDELLARLGVPA